MHVSESFSCMSWELSRFVSLQRRMASFYTFNRSKYCKFALETGGRPCAAADKLLHRLALLHEAKLTNLPPRDKLGPAGHRFLTLLRQIISASLQRAIGRRITTTADRVLFERTRGSRPCSW